MLHFSVSADIYIENKQVNTYLNMNKKLIRLTESDLHRIVKESVSRIISEMDEGKYTNNKPYFNGETDYINPRRNPTKDPKEIEKHNERVTNRKNQRIDPLARRQNSIDTAQEFGIEREDMPSTLERAIDNKHMDGFGDKSWKEYRNKLNRNRSGKDSRLGISQLMTQHGY